MRERLFREAAMAGVWLAMVGVFAVLSPAFLGARNVSMLAIELSVTATLAIGMLLVILPGQIDLAAGSGVGLFGGLAAVLVFERGMSAPAAMTIAVIAAAITWRFVGRIIVGQGVPAFIATLGGLLVLRGLHWLVIHDSTVPVTRGGSVNAYVMLTTYYVPPRAALALWATLTAVAFAAVVRRERTRGSDRASGRVELVLMQTFLGAQAALLFVLSTNQYRGLPFAAIVLGAVALTVWVTTAHTPFGRHLYAIGGNAEAAHLSGVPVERTVVLAYTLLGAVVGLTGLLQTAYAGASTTTVGNLMELDAIAACVIGGASLRGGRGTVPGVLLGAIVIATLQNGMTLLSVSPEIKLVARGLVLGLAVWADVRLSKQP
jgi:D-xylose transport system permease protein